MPGDITQPVNKVPTTDFRVVRDGEEDPALIAMRKEKDDAYAQRNFVVAALAKTFPAGIRDSAIEGWDPEWNGCVYIDLPTGQISYHYHSSEAHLFEKLPAYTKPWDGHTKEDVHERLRWLKVGDIYRPLREWIKTRRDIAATCNDLHSHEVAAITMWMDEVEKFVNEQTGT